MDGAAQLAVSPRDESGTAFPQCQAVSNWAVSRFRGPSRRVVIRAASSPVPWPLADGTATTLTPTPADAGRHEPLLRRCGDAPRLGIDDFADCLRANGRGPLALHDERRGIAR
jgi:hypothetical protein